MPQLDTATFAPQLFWLVLSFAVLYVAMARIALPRIAAVLEIRRHRIADDLEQAGQFKAQTEAALAAYEASMATARARAQSIAQETRAKLDKEIAEQEARLAEKLNRKVEEADARIAATKTKALENLNEIAGEVTAALVERLSGAKPGANDIAAALANVRTKAS